MAKRGLGIVYTDPSGGFFIIELLKNRPLELEMTKCPHGRNYHVREGAADHFY